MRRDLHRSTDMTHPNRNVSRLFEENSLRHKDSVAAFLVSDTDIGAKTPTVQNETIGQCHQIIQSMSICGHEAKLETYQPLLICLFCSKNILISFFKVCNNDVRKYIETIVSCMYSIL